MCGGTDEAHAFSPAAELVAEWQRFRFAAAETRGRVERAMAKERRWELEIAMISEFGLTLPPEAEPLEESRRDGHLRRRQSALVNAQRASEGGTASHRAARADTRALVEGGYAARL